MPSPILILSLLFAICLSIGSNLESWRQNWEGGRSQSANILSLLIGDSRKLFANHFLAKADAYFHSGYYPSIFDGPKKEESHLTACTEDHDHEEDHAKHQEKEDAGFLGEPKDWIDRFSRNFFPSQHMHLDGGGTEREILPWLRVSAELDPQRVDTYTIAAYWLRNRLGKVNEAEQFLREGLRANPDSYEIYFELGQIYDENKKDTEKARNLWEISLRKWNAQFQQEKDNPDFKPNDLIYESITARLARLEEAQGHFKQAIYYLELLQQRSPVPETIQKQIQELRTKL